MQILTPIEFAVLGKIHAMQAILDTFTREEQEAVEALRVRDLVTCTRMQYRTHSILTGIRFTDFGQTVAAAVENGHWGDFTADPVVARTGSSAGPLDVGFARDLNFIFSYEDTRDNDTIYLVPPTDPETRQRLLDTLRKWSIEFGEAERRGRTFYAVPYITHT